jgi:hypothetical protein
MAPVSLLEGGQRERNSAADRGQQGTVGGLRLGSWELAAWDAALVAQHQKLEVLGGVPAGQEREQLDGAAQREVGEP